MGIKGQIVTDERVETDVQLVPATGGRSLFGAEAIVYDDSSEWLAWEGAKQAWLANQRSENTQRAYSIAVRQFFDWAGVAPWEVGSALAQHWKRHLTEEEGLADTTINAKLAAMSSFYAFVLQSYRVPTPDGRDLSLWEGHSNPFSAVKREKVSPYGRATYPSTEEVQAMLDVINTDCLRGKRDYALLCTYTTTCRRFSEVINLCYGDIMQSEDGHYWFRYTAKGGTIRRAKLHKLVWQAICEYLRADGRLETMTADEYIFTAIDPTKAQRFDAEYVPKLNKPLSNGTVNGILNKLARRAGVDENKVHVHGLRHAGIRLDVQEQKRKEGGVDYVRVMELAGHSSLAVTQIYVSEVGDDPDDPGCDARTRRLMVQRQRRDNSPPAPEQEQLL